MMERNHMITPEITSGSTSVLACELKFDFARDFTDSFNPCYL